MRSGDSESGAEPTPTTEQMLDAANHLREILEPFHNKFAPRIAPFRLIKDRMEDIWKEYQKDILQCCTSSLNLIYHGNIVKKNFDEVEQSIGTIIIYASDHPVKSENQGALQNISTDLTEFIMRQGRFKNIDQNTQPTAQQPKPKSGWTHTSVPLRKPEPEKDKPKKPSHVHNRLKKYFNDDDKGQYPDSPSR